MVEGIENGQPESIKGNEGTDEETGLYPPLLRYVASEEELKDEAEGPSEEKEGENGNEITHGKILTLGLQPTVG